MNYDRYIEHLKCPKSYVSGGTINFKTSSLTKMVSVLLSPKIGTCITNANVAAVAGLIKRDARLTDYLLLYLDLYVLGDDA